MGRDDLWPRMSVSVETVLTLRRTRGLKRIRENDSALDRMAGERVKRFNGQSRRKSKRGLGLTPFVVGPGRVLQAGREVSTSARTPRRPAELGEVGRAHIGQRLVGQNVLARSLNTRQTTISLCYSLGDLSALWTDCEVVDVDDRVDMGQVGSRVRPPLLIVRQTLASSERRHSPDDRYELSVVRESVGWVERFEELVTRAGGVSSETRRDRARHRPRWSDVPWRHPFRR